MIFRLEQEMYNRKPEPSQGYLFYTFHDFEAFSTWMKVIESIFSVYWTHFGESNILLMIFLNLNNWKLHVQNYALSLEKKLFAILFYDCLFDTLSSFHMVTKIFQL